MTIRLSLPIPPSANRYWRTYRNQTVVSADAKAYKAGVGWQAKAVIREPLSCPIAVTLRVYRPAKRGDLDNYSKVLLDALNGVAYEDDGQIVEIHAYRHDDKSNPRVEVEITERTNPNG